MPVDGDGQLPGVLAQCERLLPGHVLDDLLEALAPGLGIVGLAPLELLEHEAAVLLVLVHGRRALADEALARFADQLLPGAVQVCVAEVDLGDVGLRVREAVALGDDGDAQHVVAAGVAVQDGELDAQVAHLVASDGAVLVVDRGGGVDHPAARAGRVDVLGGPPRSFLAVVLAQDRGQLASVAAGPDRVAVTQTRVDALPPARVVRVVTDVVPVPLTAAVDQEGHDVAAAGLGLVGLAQHLPDLGRAALAAAVFVALGEHLRARARVPPARDGGVEPVRPFLRPHLLWGHQVPVGEGLVHVGLGVASVFEPVGGHQERAQLVHVADLQIFGHPKLHVFPSFVGKMNGWEENPNAQRYHKIRVLSTYPYKKQPISGCF